MSNIINVNFINDKNKMTGKDKTFNISKVIDIPAKKVRAPHFVSPRSLYFPSVNCYLLPNTPI